MSVCVRAECVCLCMCLVRVPLLFIVGQVSRECSWGEVIRIHYSYIKPYMQDKVGEGD